MTKLYLLVLGFLLSQQFYAQKQRQNTDMKGLIEKEKKSFTQKMNIGNINPNTLNYDLQYQRMDVSLDPAVYNISGSVTSHFKPTQSMGSIYFDLSNSLPIHWTLLPFIMLEHRPPVMMHSKLLFRAELRFFLL
jgi:hypothetical protein